MEAFILSSIADGVLLLGPQGHIRYVNQVMCDMLAGGSKAIIGRHIDDFLCESELLRMLGVSDALGSADATWLQVVFKDMEDNYRPMSVTLSEFRGNLGASEGHVLVCRTQDEVRELLSESSRLAAEEIERRTELQLAKEVAEQREQLQIEAGQAQKLESIGQLAAGIAHEINTPIQFIGDNMVFLRRAFAMLSTVVETATRMRDVAPPDLAEMMPELRKVLRKAKVDYLLEEVPRAIEQSEEGIGRVTTIVRAMKEVSHPSSGEIQSVDLHRAIESTVTVARNEWKYVATVETDFAPDMPMVPCLPDAFNQVVLNIVVNAAHAIGDVSGPEGGDLGCITIRTRFDETHVEIQIGDTGTGIPDTVRDRIFDPFFTTKEVGKGTGQGLAQAYHVVTKQHGGTIEVESESGKGTTFVIRLPLVHQDRLSAENVLADDRMTAAGRG